jgi:hypothetical protein
MKIALEFEKVATRAKINGNSGGQILPDLLTLDIAGTPCESMTAASQWYGAIAHQRLGH